MDIFGSQCHRGLGVGSFYSDNQSDSNIPAVGYKLYPWGARAPQSCYIDILWWGTAHDMNSTRFSYYGNLHFVETCKSPRMKRLSSCARTYPQWGISCTPGGQSAPKLPHWHTMVRDGPWNSTRFSYYGNLHRDFSLNITLHHNVIETWGWAYFTQATNQTLRIIVTLSNNALATI